MLISNDLKLALSSTFEPFEGLIMLLGRGNPGPTLAEPDMLAFINPLVLAVDGGGLLAAEWLTALGLMVLF